MAANKERARTAHTEPTIALESPTMGWPMQDGAAASHGMLHVYRVGTRAVATITVESLRERQGLLLRDELAELLDDCDGSIALGLERVHSLGAGAAREIVCAANVCKDRAGTLVVFGLRDALGRDLRHMGVLGGVRCVRTADDALEALREPDAHRRNTGSIVRKLGLQRSRRRHAA